MSSKAHTPPSAYNSDSDDDHYPEHDHDRAHRRRRIAVVPELRFEQSYLRSIRPFVHVEHIGHHLQPQPHIDEKGKQREKPEEVEHSEVVVVHEDDIRVQWDKVLWVTTRDQVISPLIQGALWGLASHFFTPAVTSLWRNINLWWARGDTYHRSGPRVEGHGVGRLRSWLDGIVSVKPAAKPNFSR